MILQRRQSIYFLLAALIELLMPFCIFTNGVFKSNTLPMYIVLGVGGLAFITIFLFKNLKLQSFLAKFAILLNAIALITIIYRELILSGGERSSEKGIEIVGLLLLLASTVLLLLARGAVKKDLHLVKSSNSLR